MEIEEKKGFLVVGLNIRSLQSKQEQVEVLLDSKKIDILNLNESWLSSKCSNNSVRMEDYKIYRLDPKVKQRGGGLCVYVLGKHKVNAQLYEHLNLSDDNIEIMILQTEQKCTCPYTLLSIYRPPQGKHQLFIDKLRETLNNLLMVKGNSKLLVTGDFNIDLLSDSDTRSVRELKALQNEYCLRQLIKHPIRVTCSTQTLIDHIYTNVQCEMIMDCGVLENCISDHFSHILFNKET